MKEEYLIWKNRDEDVRVPLSHIVYVESNGNYSKVVQKNKLSVSIGMSLSNTYSLLLEKSNDFQRVGKRFIVNKKYVCKVSVLLQRLVLSDGDTFDFKLQISKDALKKYRNDNESEDETEIFDFQNAGALLDMSSGEKYPLHVGQNVIGRKTETSTASVQIMTSDRHMSRLHSIIEVNRQEDGSLVHVISNAENKNPTTVNGNLVEDDELNILHNGDILQFGTVQMRFEY